MVAYFFYGILDICALICLFFQVHLCGRMLNCHLYWFVVRNYISVRWRSKDSTWSTIHHIAHLPLVLNTNRLSLISNRFEELGVDLQTEVAERRKDIAQLTQTNLDNHSTILQVLARANKIGMSSKRASRTPSSLRYGMSLLCSLSLISLTSHFSLRSPSRRKWHHVKI